MTFEGGEVAMLMPASKSCPPLRESKVFGKSSSEALEPLLPHCEIKSSSEQVRKGVRLK